LGRSSRFEALEDRTLLSVVTPDDYDRVASAWFASGSDLTAPAIPPAGMSLMGSDVGPANPASPDYGARWLVRLDSQSAAEAGVVTGAAKLLNRGDVSFQILCGLGLPGQLLVQAPAGAAAAAEASLRSNPAVAYFEPDAAIQGEQTPDDPLFTAQWALHNTGQDGGTAGADIAGPAAWNLSTGNRDIVVAVVDSGVDLTHPDLTANIWTNPGEVAGNGRDDDSDGFADDVHGWDFHNNGPNPMDDNGHGTHVAGILGAAGNNGTGIAGVAWSVSIMPLKFLDENNQGSTADAVRAINYATMMRQQYGVNLRAINASWGSGQYSTALYDAIAAAGRADILVVAAAGNGDVLGRGMNNDQTGFYPASYDLDNVISVAASDNGDHLARFSNYGATSVDLAAPGVGITSTVPAGGYASKNGTSMAAPQVTGTAALVFAEVPYATAGEVRQAILQGVDVVPEFRAGSPPAGGWTPMEP
jgi:subtilisin family serine protease